MNGNNEKDFHGNGHQKTQTSDWQLPSNSECSVMNKTRILSVSAFPSSLLCLSLYGHFVFPYDHFLSLYGRCVVVLCLFLVVLHLYGRFTHSSRFASFCGCASL